MVVNQLKSLSLQEFKQSSIQPWTTIGLFSSGSLILDGRKDSYFVSDINNSISGSVNIISGSFIFATGSSIPFGSSGIQLVGPSVIGTGVFNAPLVATSVPGTASPGLVVRPVGTQTVAGTITANQGTAAVSSGWPIKIADGISLVNFISVVNDGIQPSLYGILAEGYAPGAAVNLAIQLAPASADQSGNYGVIITGSVGQLTTSNPWIITGSVISTPLPGKSLITTGSRISTNTTIQVTASPAWISSIAITSDIGGTTSTVSVSGSITGSVGKGVLINGLSTTGVSAMPTTLSFNSPLQMDSLYIGTTGAVAATIDIWLSYFQ